MEYGVQVVNTINIRLSFIIIEALQSISLCILGHQYMKIPAALAQFSLSITLLQQNRTPL
jgi:hypothetical protein